MELQLDLDTLYDWTDNNLLPLNVGKYFVIAFSNVVTLVDFDYKLAVDVKVPVAVAVPADVINCVAKLPLIVILM